MNSFLSEMLCDECGGSSFFSANQADVKPVLRQRTTNSLHPLIKNKVVGYGEINGWQTPF